MIAILRRIGIAPFVLLRSYVLRATFSVAFATSVKTTYRGIRVLLSPSEESSRERLELAREILDALWEREPHRFRRLERAVDNLVLSTDAGGGLYVPETRTLVIDLSHLDEYESDDRDLVVGLSLATMLYHVTYHKLARLRPRADASRREQIDRLCTREVARWFRRWYPEIHDAIDWDAVEEETKQRRLQMNRLSFLERFREHKRAMQTNPLGEHATRPDESK